MKESPVNALAHIPSDLVYDWDFVAESSALADPIAAYTALDERGAPKLFWSPHHGGHWVARDYDDVRAILTRQEDFSPYPINIPPLTSRPRKLVPVELDPPEHMKYRMIIQPAFAPKVVKEREDAIRKTAVALIEQLATSGQCLFGEAFARRLPSIVFLQLMGMPGDRLEEFLGWEHMVFRGNDQERVQGGLLVGQFFMEFIREKHAHPDDGLVSQIIAYRDKDGQPIAPEYIFDLCFMLFFGGLDTVASTLSFAWNYLARHPEKQVWIVENPDKISAVVEELLRITATVNTTRTVRRDMTFRGIPMKKDQPILIALGSANRTSDAVDDPGRVSFEREANRHLSFGFGAHTCIGMHLARSELRIAVEEWFKRIPRFRLQDGAQVHVWGHCVMGIAEVPLAWGPV